MKQGEKKMEAFLEKFAQNCKEHGDKAALVCGDSRLSYAELDELSDEVAFYLHQRRIGKEQFAAVHLERGTDCVAAIIGIWKAGAAFICLPETYPQERIRFICEDCSVSLMVNRETMEEIRSSCKGKKAELPFPAPYDAAMAIYTSGSTGNPKGVLHEHRSISGAVGRFLLFTGLTERDIFMSNSPFSFVAFLVEIIAPLYAGCTVHFLPEEERRDIHTIEDYMEKEAVTATFMTVQLRKYFKRPPRSLRVLFTAAERLSNATGDGYILINGYGSSEAAATLSFQTERSYENTPIGKPVAGLGAYLLDESGKPVPDGTDGELCLSGIFARGYINLPEQTARVFTENPFASQDGNAVLYHTGDIARRLPDGNLVYINRKDWQVKINGQRVETGEIEVRLKQLEKIEGAAVVAFQNDRGQNYLCAFYTAGDSEITDKEIRSWLKQSLPDYMVPPFFVRLKEFPLNQNGKLDRRALTPPEHIPRQKYVAPETAEQKKICAVFAELLHLADVSAEENFFDLGGDSLLAIELVNGLKEAGYSLKVADIYSAPTPRLIADLLKSRDTSEALPPVQRDPGNGRFSMSETQIMMARFSLAMEKDGIDHRLADIDCWYDIGREFIDYPRLADAVAGTRRDFEIFRLNYDLTDFTLVPAADGALQLLLEELPDVYRIRIRGSHLLMDNVFNQFILQRIQSYYQGSEPASFVRFRDYAGWLRKLQMTAIFREAEAYYQDMKEKLRSCHFTVHPAENAQKWKCVFQVVEAARPHGVDELLRELHCSEYVLYFSLYMRLLSERQNGPAGCFAVLNHRMLPELAGLEGCGTNRFYLCMDARHADLKETVAAVYAGIKKAMRYACFPAWTVIDPQCEEFPYTAFNFPEIDRSGSIYLGDHPLSSGQMTYSPYFDIPLLLGLEKDRDKLRVTFLGREDMTNAQELKELAVRYSEMLAGLEQRNAPEAG
jgi:amino acid adenylation domain-containing protein